MLLWSNLHCPGSGSAQAKLMRARMLCGAGRGDDGVDWGRAGAKVKATPRHADKVERRKQREIREEK